MRVIKISLVVIVIAAIVFFVFRSCVTTDKIGEIQKGDNPFVNKILEEIKELGNKPDSRFCKDFYEQVVYHIDYDYKDNRFGKSKLENDQIKQNLAKQLYAVYAGKYVQQVYYIFNRSEWNIGDLDFIRSENKRLQSSSLLERNSEVDKAYSEIGSILNKYDEVSSFITICNKFSFLERRLDILFPIEDVKSKMSKARDYSNNFLGNTHVNNCTRLHSGINEIPDALYNAHIAYLNNKMDYWSENYSDYNSQKAYNDNLWLPINNEIESLDINIYGKSGYNPAYSGLHEKWNAIGTKAYYHFTVK